ncbi:MAG: SDR family oxidoreductase [Clostridiales bacterium]|nr:SDR family oxidoreductase [Clostridiales bacterium]
MKSILVTGASGGIGQAICREMAKCGYFVGVHYNTNKEKAETLAKEIGGVAVCFDVKNSKSVEEGIKSFAKKSGGLSALVCSAGIAQTIKPVVDITDEEFDEVVAVNLKGVFNANKYALPYMFERGGAIVNISSMWGLVGSSCESVYSATKSAVLGFTKSLAKEYASANIRVNAIAAGYIDTSMNDNLSKEDKALAIEDVPFKRAGTPEEVAKCVRFLIEDGSFISGETLNVSAGEVIV